MFKIFENNNLVVNNYAENLATLDYLYDMFRKQSEYTLLSETVQTHYKCATYDCAYGIVTVAISFATLG